MSESLRTYFENIERAYECEEVIRVSVEEVERLKTEQSLKNDLHSYWTGKKARLSHFFHTGVYVDDNNLISQQHKFTPFEKFHSDFCQLLENLSQRMDYYRQDYMNGTDDEDSADEFSPLRLLPDPQVGAVKQSCEEWVQYLEQESFFINENHKAARDCLLMCSTRALAYFALFSQKEVPLVPISLEMFVEGAEFMIHRLGQALVPLVERIELKTKEVEQVRASMQLFKVGVTQQEIDQHFKLASAQKEVELGFPLQENTFGGLMILRTTTAGIAESPPSSPVTTIGVKRIRHHSGERKSWTKKPPTEAELLESIFGDKIRFEALQRRIPLYVLAWQKHMCIVNKASGLPGIEIADNQKFMLEYWRFHFAVRGFRNSRCKFLHREYLETVTKSTGLDHWDLNCLHCVRHGRLNRNCTECIVQNCVTPTKYHQLAIVLMVLQSPGEPDQWLTYKSDDFNMITHLVYRALSKDELIENWHELQGAEDVVSCVTR